MKIQVCSDLHLEFDKPHLPIIDPSADVIVYAGDLATNEDVVASYFHDVRKKTNAVILYVLGNHEFYGKFLHSVSDYKIALRDILDVQVLDCDTFNYRGVKFIGCTLWTDFDDRRGEVVAQQGMADFKSIRKIGKYYDLSYVIPEDLIKEHRKCLEFLRKEFYHASFHPGPTVVITHHGPSFYCVPEKYKENKLNGAFFVELSGLIMAYKPVLWVYGHSHDFNDSTIGKTRLVCNPSGYPFEINDHKSTYVIEV